MNRNALVDHVRGYACFLVLFGHVLSGMRNAGIPAPLFFHGLEDFIWTFHVAVFFFLSGTVYRITGGWESKKTKKAFVLHKLLTLGVPYVVFSTVYIGINSFVGTANTQFSLRDILLMWKTPVAQYWYLYALFFLFFLWTVLSGTWNNRQITVALVLVSFLAPLFDVSFGSFAIVIYAALAFGFGTTTSVEVIVRIPLWGKLMTMILHVVVGAVMVHYGLQKIRGISELLTVLGISASIMLIGFLTKSRWMATLLSFINRYSLQIYLLHTIFTAATRIVLLRLGITQWGIHMIVGCIAGFAFSVLVAKICEKIPLFEACFFPAKAWGKLKNKK